MSSTTEPRHQPQGIYGVRVTGLNHGDSMGVVPEEWPEWRVTTDVVNVEADARPERVDQETALLRFGDGSVVDARRAGLGGAVHVTLSSEVSDGDIAHPYLAAIGMVSAFWGDRVPLHAGAVGIDGRAWLIIAAKAGGKSTSLAILETAGYPVLADDLSVIDAGLRVHRGPRFIDLRKEAASALGVGEYVGVLGVRERWRYRIGAAPLSLPLGGIVIPGWGQLGLQPVSGSSRLSLLAPELALRIPGPWDALFMDVVSSVPVVHWIRPNDLDQADRGVDDLLEFATSV